LGQGNGHRTVFCLDLLVFSEKAQEGLRSGGGGHGDDCGQQQGGQDKKGFHGLLSSSVFRFPVALKRLCNPY